MVEAEKLYALLRKLDFWPCDITHIISGYLAPSQSLVIIVEDYMADKSQHLYCLSRESLLDLLSSSPSPSAPPPSLFANDDADCQDPLNMPDTATRWMQLNNVGHATSRFNYCSNGHNLYTISLKHPDSKVVIANCNTDLSINRKNLEAMRIDQEQQEQQHLYDRGQSLLTKNFGKFVGSVVDFDLEPDNGPDNGPDNDCRSKSPPNKAIVFLGANILSVYHLPTAQWYWELVNNLFEDGCSITVDPTTGIIYSFGGRQEFDYYKLAYMNLDCIKTLQISQPGRRKPRNPATDYEPYNYCCSQFPKSVTTTDLNEKRYSPASVYVPMLNGILVGGGYDVSGEDGGIDKAAIMSMELFKPGTDHEPAQCIMLPWILPNDFDGPQFQLIDGHILVATMSDTRYKRVFYDGSVRIGFVTDLSLHYRQKNKKKKKKKKKSVDDDCVLTDDINSVFDALKWVPLPRIKGALDKSIEALIADI